MQKSSNFVQVKFIDDRSFSLFILKGNVSFYGSRSFEIDMQLYIYRQLSNF